VSRARRIAIFAAASVLLGSCQWLDAGQLVCTDGGDSSCPDWATCGPADADGVHRCVDNGGSVGDDDTGHDDDDTVPGDDDTAPGDDDTAPGDDDAGDDDTGDDDTGDDDTGDDDTGDDDTGDDDTGDDDAGDDDTAPGDDDTAPGDDDAGDDDAGDDDAGDDDAGDDDTGAPLGPYQWSRWTPSPAAASQALYAVSFPANQALLGWAVGTSATILHTLDGGVSWLPQSVGGWSGTLNDVFFINNTIGWAVGDGGTVLWTENSGADWYQESPIGSAAANPDITSVYAASDQLVYFVTVAGEVFRSTNGGQANWSLQATQSHGLRAISGSTDWSNPRVWAVGDSGTFGLGLGTGNPAWRSDLGANLTAVSLAGDGNGWAVGADAMIGMTGVVLKTVNFGSNWSAVTNVTSGPVTPFSDVEFVGDDHGWVVTQDRVFRTENAGLNWHEESAGFSLTPQNFDWIHDIDFVDPTHGWAVGNYGLILIAAPPPAGDDDTTGDDDDDDTTDSDGDGFEAGIGPGLDCNDGNADIHPGAWDGPGDSTDNDCDGAVDVTLASASGIGFRSECTDPSLPFAVGPGGGDFDGDGYADLVFGNPGWTGSSCSSMDLAGRAYLWNSPAAGGPLPALGVSIDLGSSTSGQSQFDGASQSHTGLSTALGGNINGDIYDDLLIAAPMAGTSSGAEVGIVYLLLGSSAGAGCSPGTALATCADFVFYGAGAYDYTGTTVAWAGDITGDGVDEILIGAPGYDSERGRVYLLDGGKIEWDINFGQTGMYLSSVGAVNYPMHAVIGGQTSLDKLGGVMPAVGDLDGDNRADFVLASDSAASGNGAVYVFYASGITAATGGTGGVHPLSFPGTTFNNATVTAAQRRLEGGDPGLGIGAAVALLPDLGLDAGEFLPELAIGAPYAQGTDGAVYIVNSATINGGAFGTILVSATSNAAATIGGVWNSGELFGASLIGADIDGDGLGDLVVCAPYAGGATDSAGGWYSGPGHGRLYRGSTLSSSPAGASFTAGDADAVFIGEVPSSGSRVGDSFCSSLGFPGDVDGDGSIDLLIVASGWNNSTSAHGRGKAYLFPNPLLPPVLPPLPH
jgi:photosystem II stability/assembly factor-like uncharacterized protein